MKIARLVCCLCLFLVGILAISQSTAVLAQDEYAGGRVDLTTKYPKVEILSGESAEFEVDIKYYMPSTEEVRQEYLEEFIEATREFDLVATGPKDWYVYITPSYPREKMIASITLQSGPQSEKIVVTAIPAYWFEPEPREYKITLEAISGETKGTIELTVEVTAKYTLALVPATERYNTSATAGKDNYFSIKVLNNGTAAIDNITFYSDKPQEWAIEFSPHKVDSLEAGDYQTIDVNIKPPSKTIAGDYSVTLGTSGKQTSAERLDIRVTVETPTVWGWVGVGIVIAVIAGLIVTFRRFSRR